MQRFASPPRAPHKAPKIPTILISDHTVVPITTTHYICHSNELAFEPIYKRIKALLRHPLCSHRATPESWPCAPCESAFSQEYWSCAAYLLDYFADFLSLDTPLMQDAWFHLLDTWQETMSFFPCADVLAELSVSPDAVQAYTKARWQSKNFKDTLDLMDTVIHGIRNKNVSREPVIHTPSGGGTGVMGEYNTGPWISGLKPWQQFLCDGGPGVAEDEDEEDIENEEGKRTCYLPLPGINMIKTHTARARVYAALLTPDPDSMAAFDEKSLKFPKTVKTEAHEYQSSVDGASVAYRLTDGAPPIMRHRGYMDVVRRHPRPSLSMLDDFVATCRRLQPLHSVSGGAAQDDEEEEEDGVMEPFDIWTVTVAESKGVEGGGGRE
jgi:hypothetical protein